MFRQMVEVFCFRIFTRYEMSLRSVMKLHDSVLSHFEGIVLMCISLEVIDFCHKARFLLRRFVKFESFDTCVPDLDLLISTSKLCAFSFVLTQIEVMSNLAFLFIYKNKMIRNSLSTKEHYKSEA